MEVVPCQVRHRRPERRDLRQRQVHEDDPALDDVHAEIGVDPRQDQARDEGGEQDLEDRHFLAFMELTKASMS
jgi:hypothetical protein